MQPNQSHTAPSRKDKQKFYYFSNQPSTILGGECKIVALQEGKLILCYACRHNPYNSQREDFGFFYRAFLKLK